MTVKIYVNEVTEDISTYQDAISLAGMILFENKCIKQDYIDACIDREVLYPTGLSLGNGIGVAIPHGDSDLVLDNSISVLRLSKPVSFGLMEDNKQQVSCDLIFNLALTTGNTHIEMLRKIMGLLQDDNFIDMCLNEKIDDVKKYIESKLI